METLFQLIKSNDVTKVQDWLRTYHGAVGNHSVYPEDQLIDDAKWLYTQRKWCDLVISDSRQLLVIYAAISEGKDLNLIKALVNVDKNCFDRNVVLVENPLMNAVGSNTNVHKSNINLNFIFNPLKNAVEANRELDLIQFLLDNKVDVNFCDTLGCTPLHYAMRSEVVKLLIENGANVNSKDKVGTTPLMTALDFKRDKEIILELLMNGASVDDMLDIDGKSCLHLALQNKCDEDIIREMCRKTVNYNQEDSNGKTPLYYAVCEDRWLSKKHYCGLQYGPNFIQELVNKGFIVSYTLFKDLVQNCKNVEGTAIMAKYVDIRCVDKNGNGVLHLAEDVLLINKLARRGADVNHKNNKGITPLNDAIMHYKRLDVIESLLLWGADIKKEDYLLNWNGNRFQDAFYDLLVLFGMSVSLKRDCLEGLVSRILTFYIRTGSRYTLGLLRHIFVSNENVEISENLLLNDECNKLIETYKSELNKMKDELCTHNISYYDFCIKQYRFVRSKFVSEGLKKSDLRKLRKLFPNFNKEVEIKIKLNIKINRRKVLLRMLSSLNLTKLRSSENKSNQNDNSICEYVWLDGDCMNLVGLYMNNRDINCLLAAAIS